MEDVEGVVEDVEGVVDVVEGVDDDEVSSSVSSSPEGSSGSLDPVGLQAEHSSRSEPEPQNTHGGVSTAKSCANNRG